MFIYCTQRRKGRFENKKAVTCLFLESQNNSDSCLYKILISVLGRTHIFVLSGYVIDGKCDIEALIQQWCLLVSTCIWNLGQWISEDRASHLTLMDKVL